MGSFAKVEKVLYFECSEQVMEQRLLKRGESSGRSDDNADVIRKRFNTYVKETVPIIEAFGKEGLVVKIDAGQTPDKVSERIQPLQLCSPSRGIRLLAPWFVPCCAAGLRGRPRRHCAADQACAAEAQGHLS